MDRADIQVPQKLKPGDTVMVVAPSDSLSFISPEIKELALTRLKELGLKVVFGGHVDEVDSFDSSSIALRVADLHDAFSRKEVKAILTAFGGFNCNELLPFLDWNLIRKNPKPIIGYSDTTALQNALFAKTGIISYSGPIFARFGQKLYLDYSLEYFKKCLFTDEPFSIFPSDSWSDDKWHKDQDKRELKKNDGWLVLHEGEAEGRILGGNLSTFNLLQGTEYFPDISGAVLFIEDDSESKKFHFDRDLTSLTQQPNFSSVRGLVIGRFQKESTITPEDLQHIIETKKELAGIPVLAGVDFGHTDPLITFPIGGTAKLTALNGKSSLEILAH